MMENTWQPIETAPADKTWILLTGGKIDGSWDGNWNGDVQDEPTMVVAQSRAGREGQTFWQFAWYDSGYYGEYENPSHWMPLPRPPQK